MEDYEDDYYEEQNDYGMGSCPECGSKKYISVPRGEHCDNCGFYQYYP